MQMLYNSDSYAVVQIEMLPEVGASASQGPGTSAGGRRHRGADRTQRRARRRSPARRPERDDRRSRRPGSGRHRG